MTIVERSLIVDFIKLIIANAIKATALAEIPSNKTFIVDKWLIFGRNFAVNNTIINDGKKIPTVEIIEPGKPAIT